jgi:hypothetical protein
MKKLVVIVLAAFLVMTFAGVSFATKDNTGCGLGYIIFKGKDGLVSRERTVLFRRLLLPPPTAPSVIKPLASHQAPQNATDLQVSLRMKN